MGVKEDLKEQIQEIEGSELKSHWERQALILLQSHMSLLEVGLAFAQDEKLKVQDWLEKGEIWKCTENDLSELSNQIKYEFLILQPFVIAQKQDPTLH